MSDFRAGIEAAARVADVEGKRCRELAAHPDNDRPFRGTIGEVYGAEALTAEYLARAIRAIPSPDTVAAQSGEPIARSYHDTPGNQEAMDAQRGIVDRSGDPTSENRPERGGRLGPGEQLVTACAEVEASVPPDRKGLRERVAGAFYVACHPLDDGWEENKRLASRKPRSFLAQEVQKAYANAGAIMDEVAKVVEGLREERDTARSRNGDLALALRDEKLKKQMPPSALLVRAEGAEAKLAALEARPAPEEVNPDYVSETPRWDRLGRRVPTIAKAAALSAPPVRDSGWQPIETAPENDTAVLMWGPEMTIPEVSWWWADARLTATHWMPLPALPAQRGTP